MSVPLVSVIIPAYGQAAFLGDAIRSVLEQTYATVEVIVVNDASPDDSAAVARGFDDPRLTLLEHETNRGLSAARNSGIRAAKGELIALLDADDLFLADKLERHVVHYNAYPNTGATYNARYELNYSATTVRTLYRPPSAVGLADFVLGFPFAPSDLVIRREWLDRVGGFDERLVYFGEDQEMYCRLGLAGCPFGYVEQALNQRRHHSGRYDRRFAERLNHDREILAAVVGDPRCPPEVRALHDEGLANHLIVRAYHAFALEQTPVGQALLREAVARSPRLLNGDPNGVIRMFTHDAAVDTNVEMDEFLKRIQRQLPEELAWNDSQRNWMVGRGLLIRGTHAAMWGQAREAATWFGQAAARAAATDDNYLRWAAHLLEDVDILLGVLAGKEKLDQVKPHLEAIGGAAAARRLEALVEVNRAFRRHRQMQPGAAAHALRAIRLDRRFAGNRGLWAVIARAPAAALGQSERDAKTL